MMQGQANIR